MSLTALQCVVCLVDGQARQFEPGAPLPDMPADEAERLLQLGAARAPTAVAEGKPARRKRAARAAADGAGEGEGTADGAGEGEGTADDDAAAEGAATAPADAGPAADDTAAGA